jgi:hypothetical protein
MKTTKNQSVTGQVATVQIISKIVTLLMSAFFCWYLIRTIQIIILNY